MRIFKGWLGWCAVIGLSGCATGHVTSWTAPDAEPFLLRGEKVAAVVMATDRTVRRAGEHALARELSARGVVGVPMYTLLPGSEPDEARARAAAGQAGIVGVVVMRPAQLDPQLSWKSGTYRGPIFQCTPGSGWSGTEISTDTVVVETLVYDLIQNRLVWAGQSKSRNSANVIRLIESTAKQVAGELVRQGLIPSQLVTMDIPGYGWRPPW